MIAVSSEFENTGVPDSKECSAARSLEPARACHDGPRRGFAGGVRTDFPPSFGKDFAMTSVFGTWRLVRAVSLDGDGSELPAPYGGHPAGRVMLGADGRMMAVTCDGRREIP